MTKQFHIGDVLSISTGFLLSPSGMSGIYDILNWMTQDNLFTHQLPRALKECQPWIFRQYPQLDTEETRDSATAFQKSLQGNKSNEERNSLSREFVAKMQAKFGEFLAVSPIPSDDHQVKDPITEAVEIIGADKVIVIEEGK